MEGNLRAPELELKIAWDSEKFGDSKRNIRGFWPEMVTKKE